MSYANNFLEIHNEYILLYKLKYPADDIATVKKANQPFLTLTFLANLRHSYKTYETTTVNSNNSNSIKELSTMLKQLGVRVNPTQNLNNSQLRKPFNQNNKFKSNGNSGFQANQNWISDFIQNPNSNRSPDLNGNNAPFRSNPSFNNWRSQNAANGPNFSGQKTFFAKKGKNKSNNGQNQHAYLFRSKIIKMFTIMLHKRHKIFTMLMETTCKISKTPREITCSLFRA